MKPVERCKREGIEVSLFNTFFQRKYSLKIVYDVCYTCCLRGQDAVLKGVKHFVIK